MISFVYDLKNIWFYNQTKNCSQNRRDNDPNDFW
jgi:hypothetical protein